MCGGCGCGLGSVDKCVEGCERLEEGQGCAAEFNTMCGEFQVTLQTLPHSIHTSCRFRCRHDAAPVPYSASPPPSSRSLFTHFPICHLHTLHTSCRFRYRGDAAPILDGVSFSVPAGATYI